MVNKLPYYVHISLHHYGNCITIYFHTRGNFFHNMGKYGNFFAIKQFVIIHNMVNNHPYGIYHIFSRPKFYHITMVKFLPYKFTVKQLPFIFQQEIRGNTVPFRPYF